MKTKLHPHIRWMIRRDMPEVLQIEQDSFEYAWTEEDFLRCLRERNCIGTVAEREEEIVGYMVYEFHEKKLHLLNFAASPKYRNLGVGSSMIRKLQSKLSSHRRTGITLEVRETNLDAQFFFNKMGFQARKVLRAHYDDSGEDAYLMRYRIAEPEQRNEEEIECLGR